MSATTAIGYLRVSNTISNRCGTKFGPFSKHSLIEVVRFRIWLNHQIQLTISYFPGPTEFRHDEVRNASELGRRCVLVRACLKHEMAKWRNGTPVSLNSASVSLNSASVSLNITSVSLNITDLKVVSSR